MCDGWASVGIEEGFCSWSRPAQETSLIRVLVQKESQLKPGLRVGSALAGSDRCSVCGFGWVFPALFWGFHVAGGSACSWHRTEHPAILPVSAVGHPAQNCKRVSTDWYQNRFWKVEPKFLSSHGPEGGEGLQGTSTLTLQGLLVPDCSWHCRLDKDSSLVIKFYFLF